jgi:hypothetical protein
MAENVQETRPPETPLQARKPTERTEAANPDRPDQSRQSAQQDVHSAARAEFAEATTARRSDSLPRRRPPRNLANSSPHLADFDLLSHERFEANYMADTGDPSYRRAHEASIEAGYTWHSEAAANDGFGYQQRRP